MSRTCVLVVNWNGWADTIECLESLFRYIDDDVRVIVCDNGSTDNSLEKLKAWAEGRLELYLPPTSLLRKLSWPPVPKPISFCLHDQVEAEQGGDAEESARLVLIRNRDNLGFAGGNNVGLRYLMARGDFDFVWLLNNDTVAADGALEALYLRMQDRPEIGMCGSTLLHYEQPERVQARGGGWYCHWLGLPWHVGQLGRSTDPVNEAKVEGRINYVVGASMMVSRTFLTRIGLMSEEFFLYYEELDWAMRSRGLFSLGFARHSVVYHKIGASIGTRTDPRKKSLTCDYYNIRNRIRYTRQYLPLALLTVYPILCLAALNRLLFGQWRRGLMVLRLMLSGGRDLKGFLPGA